MNTEIKLSKETTLLAEALISLRYSYDKCLAAMGALAERDPTTTEFDKMHDCLEKAREFDPLGR